MTGRVRGAVDEPQRFPGKSLTAGDVGEIHGLLCHLGVHVHAMLAGTGTVGQQCRLAIDSASQRLVVCVIGEPRGLGAQIRCDDQQRLSDRGGVVALVEDPAGIREMS